MLLSMNDKKFLFLEDLSFFASEFASIGKFEFASLCRLEGNGVLAFWVSISLVAVTRCAATAGGDELFSFSAS